MTEQESLAEKNVVASVVKQDSHSPQNPIADSDTSEVKYIAAWRSFLINNNFIKFAKAVLGRQNSGGIPCSKDMLLLFSCNRLVNSQNGGTVGNEIPIEIYHPYKTS